MCARPGERRCGARRGVGCKTPRRCVEVARGVRKDTVVLSWDLMVRGHSGGGG